MHKLLFAFLALSLCRCQKQEMDGELYKVYGVDFQKFIKANPVTLVALHDRSQFSQRLIATLHELAKKFLSENIPIKIAKMSVREASSFLKLWNVTHVPHIRLYVGNGVYDELKAYPSLNTLYKWSVTILDNPEKITLIDSDAKVEKFNKEKFAFYLRFPQDQPQYLDLLKKFQKLDSSLKVYYTHKAAYDPFESYNPKELVVGFRRHFDDGNKFLASERKLNQVSIHNFFELFRRPTFNMLTLEFADYFKEKMIRALVLFDGSEASTLLTEFKKAALHHHKNIHFVFANTTEPQTQELASLAQVDTTNLPQMRIIDTVDGQKRVFKVNATNAAEIREALEKYANGELANLLEDEAAGEL